MNQLGLLLLTSALALAPACEKTKPATKAHEHKDGDGHEHKDDDKHKDGDGHEHKEGDGHDHDKKE
jgi:hypothetical protein